MLRGWLIALSLVSLVACESAEERQLKDYVYGSYYTVLAKDRGDYILEFQNIVKSVDLDNLPTTDAKQLEMLPFLER